MFKINSCGLRAQRAKRRTDAGDAEALLSQAVAKLPLTLTDRQKSQLELALDSVIEHSRQDEDWWRARLGMQARK